MRVTITLLMMTMMMMVLIMVDDGDDEDDGNVLRILCNETKLFLSTELKSRSGSRVTPGQ
jgi:hypothetical protein